jgi:hypothetical protein
MSAIVTVGRFVTRSFAGMAMGESVKAAAAVSDTLAVRYERAVICMDERLSG